jgi:mannose-6-phosphate isomerase-like protein (cupin superfamily)
MPDAGRTVAADLTNSGLAQQMEAFVGRYTDKSFDWDAFPGSRGFPDLQRAQLRYIGAGGSPKTDDPGTLKAEHFTFSLVNQPVGKFAASHSHEIVEHFLVLQGVLTVGWVWGDEVIEIKLGPKDMVLNKLGRPHGFRNDGIEPVLMQITVGSGTPLAPVYVCHPKSKNLELSRAFGAPGPDKIHAFQPHSADLRQQEAARHVVRYRDRTPVWNDAGFARMTYIGDTGAPPQNYRMDLIHLPRGRAIAPYVRDVEDVYFVVEGAITVGWEEGGKVTEKRLGVRDLILNPAGRPHYFRNDGATDAQFSMVVGTPKAETVGFKAV